MKRASTQSGASREWSRRLFLFECYVKEGGRNLEDLVKLLADASEVELPQPIASKLFARAAEAIELFAGPKPRRRPQKASTRSFDKWWRDHDLVNTFALLRIHQFAAHLPNTPDIRDQAPQYEPPHDDRNWYRINADMRYSHHSRGGGPGSSIRVSRTLASRVPDYYGPLTNPTG